MVVYHAWVLTGGPLLGGGRAVLSGGFLAVDLFFVPSAFVLTLPAARTGSFGSWRDYALRRAARILPAYYVALAVALILFHPLAGPAADTRPPTADSLLAAPQLPAGRGAADPGLRRRARLPREPGAVDALGRGRVLRRVAARDHGLPAPPAAVAARRGRRDRRAARAGAGPGRRGDPGPPALAAADVRRRLRGRDGGRVAVRPRGDDPRLDGRARGRGGDRGAVGVRGADRRRRPGSARASRCGWRWRRRPRSARSSSPPRPPGLGGPTTAARAGSARSPTASSSSTSW